MSASAPPRWAGQLGASGALGLVRRLGTTDPASYRPHGLHSSERIWSETNCYVDLWIELLHALGCDPLAACAFTLSTDFEGDQWSFFKLPPEDLRELFGIEVAEMNAWRDIATHVGEQLGLGRLLTVEVDAFYLPDTREVSYRIAHQKTTIATTLLDPARPSLRYFHGAGYYELDGEDVAGALREGAGSDALPPYVELVKLERLVRRPPGELAEISLGLARTHLERRPHDNPVERLGKRLSEDLEWVSSGDPELFHAYAFATCRQCGSSAEIAAAYAEWLAERTGRASRAPALLRELAEGAKTIQFGLARLARGRRFDLDGALAAASRAWDEATCELWRTLSA